MTFARLCVASLPLEGLDRVGVKRLVYSLQLLSTRHIAVRPYRRVHKLTAQFSKWRDQRVLGIFVTLNAALHVPVPTRVYVATEHVTKNLSGSLTSMRTPFWGCLAVLGAPSLLTSSIKSLINLERVDI